MKTIKTVQIKISDSLLKLELTKIYVAVNCTNDEALSFFGSINEMKPHIKLSIKCGVDIDEMSDHGELVNELKDINLVREALYFRSNDTTECLNCAMRHFKKGIPGLAIGEAKIGSEL
ncbi:hypothetical protein VPHK122_0006 [Vibrio phage K122]